MLTLFAARIRIPGAYLLKVVYENLGVIGLVAVVIFIIVVAQEE